MLCVQVRAESLYVNVFLVSDSFLQPPVLWCSSDGTFSILIHSRCEFVGSRFFISDTEHIPYIYTMGDAQDLSRAAFLNFESDSDDIEISVFTDAAGVTLNGKLTIPIRLAPTPLNGVAQKRRRLMVVHEPEDAGDD